MSTTLKASNTPLESLSKKPAFKDALDYLEAIKRTFRDSPAKYNSFLDIMKDFKCQKLSTPQVMEMVKSLFANEEELRRGFSMFLPEAFQASFLQSCDVEDGAKDIEASKEEERIKRETEIFTESLLSAYSQQPDVGQLFNELMEQWSCGESSDESMFESIAILLQKNRVLQSAFIMCLPIKLVEVYTKFIRAFNEEENGDPAEVAPTKRLESSQDIEASLARIVLGVSP